MKTSSLSNVTNLESSLEFLRKKRERSNTAIKSLPQATLEDKALHSLRSSISDREGVRLELCKNYLLRQNSIDEQLTIFEQLQPTEKGVYDDPSFFKAVTISQSDFDELEALKRKIEPLEKVELLENMFLALEDLKSYLKPEEFVQLQESLQNCTDSLNPEKAQINESSTDDPFKVFEDKFNRLKASITSDLNGDIKKGKEAKYKNEGDINEKKQSIENIEKKANKTFGNRFRKFFGLKVKIDKDSQAEITSLKTKISSLEKENTENSKVLTGLEKQRSHLESKAKVYDIKSEAVSSFTDSCQSTLDRNTDILKKFFSDREKFLKGQQEKEQRKSEVKESFSEAFKERVLMFIYRAKLVDAGEVVMADTKTQKVLSAASSAAELSPIPYVNTAINFLSTCFSKYTESKNEKKLANTLGVSKISGFDEFMDKFMNKFMQTFSQNSEFKKLESLSGSDKQVFDQQAVELAKRIMKGIAKAKVEVSEKIKEGKIDEAVEEAIDYVLKPKKETKDFSKQAIIVLDKQGNGVVLCEESRFATDSKQGFHKYGARPATEAEQKSFQDGSLKGYQIYKTKEELLTDAIGKKVSKSVFGQVIEYAANFKVEKDSKLPTADDLKAFLESLEKYGLKKGKRNALNVADKDRENFNEVKDLLSSLVGNIHENRSFESQQKDDKAYVEALVKDLKQEMQQSSRYNASVSSSIGRGG